MRRSVNLTAPSRLPNRAEVAAHALAFLARLCFGRRPIAIRLPVSPGKGN